ncbi:unnamed protein product, partial [Ectocarpus sp. 13 AM-2016]
MGCGTLACRSLSTRDMAGSRERREVSTAPKRHGKVFWWYCLAGGVCLRQCKREQTPEVREMWQKKQRGGTVRTRSPKEFLCHCTRGGEFGGYEVGGVFESQRTSVSVKSFSNESIRNSDTYHGATPRWRRLWREAYCSCAPEASRELGGSETLRETIRMT